MPFGGLSPLRLFWTAGLAPLLVAQACGGRAESFGDGAGSGGSGGHLPEAGVAGSGAFAGRGPNDAGTDAASAGAEGDAQAGAPGDAAADAGPDGYDDPGCPDAAAAPGIEECDLFGEPSGCAAGEGCYPYIEHPYGDGCAVQTFGTLCLFAGSGTQGAECGADTDGCAPGFICVIGAKPGKRCVQMCDLNGTSTCTGGLFCGETDVEGVGVCS